MYANLCYNRYRDILKLEIQYSATTEELQICHKPSDHRIKSLPKVTTEDLAVHVDMILPNFCEMCWFDGSA